MTGALAIGRRAAAAMLLALAVLLPPVAAAADARLPDGTLAVPALARVTDTTGTLSAGQKQALEDKLAAFEKARGTQIAVVMVGSTQPEPISDFAQRIGDAWKIGRHEVGDGLLIVVAKDDRRVWIAVAKALEGAIPDLAAARVIREQITPRFRQGDFASGIGAGLDSIFKLVQGEGLPQPESRGRGAAGGEQDLAALLAPFVILGVMVTALLRKVLGVKGALLGGAGTGTVAGFVLSSLAMGLLAGVAAFLFSLFLGGGGGGGGRVLGGRRGGVFIPGGWSGGGGRIGGGGWSGGGGGWSSGGGGNFGGGGAGGSW